MVLRTLLRRLIALGVLGSAFGLITGYLGFLHPLFDTASNFRMHLGLGLLLGLPIILWLSHIWVRMTAVLVCAFALGGSINGISFDPLAGSPTVKSEGSIRLIAHNILFDNLLGYELPARLSAYDPDILFVTEISDYWDEQVRLWKVEFPHFHYCPEWQNSSGSYIFSKFPIASEGQYCQAYSAFMISPLMIDGSRIDIGGAHFRWPWPASGPEQISQAQPAIEALFDDSLVVGDFNSVPWSYSLQRIREFGGLSLHNGVGPTWLFQILPEFMRQWVGLPIDNVLKKGAVEIISTQRLPSLGSDHMPVMIDFQLRP